MDLQEKLQKKIFLSEMFFFVSIFCSKTNLLQSIFLFRLKPSLLSKI